MLDNSSKTKVATLTVCTLGIYYFYWCYQSKQAINKSANQELIPTNWLLVIPGVNYWWMWEYSEALEKVSFGRLKQNDTFLLYIVLTIGIWFINSTTYNIDVFGNSDSNHLSWTIFGILIGGFALLSIAGLAAFCAIMQGRINKLSAKPIS
jgi:hypothetical protein